jgi:predicted nucleotidyltransferase
MMERAKVIENIKQVALKTLPPSSSLILYGSRARGDYNDNSDWDLLILLDKPELTDSDYDNVSFPFTLLGWNIGELISPQMYTKKEWDSISFLPFYKNVEQDKIVLV